MKLKNKLRHTISVLASIWSLDKRVKTIHQEIIDQRIAIIRLKHEVLSLKNWVDEYYATLTQFTESLNVMVWRKNSDLKYRIANKLHCIRLYKLKGTDECLQFIIGKTCKDLIDHLFGTTGIENSFDKISLISDLYTKEQKAICHFFEGGVIDGEQLLLYTVKIPFFNNGKFAGIICLGWDITMHSAWIIHQLNRWIYDSKAIKLYHDKNVFAYHIKPIVKQCDIFKSVCTQAMDGDNDMCNLCGHYLNGCSKNRLLNKELNDV